MPPLPRRLLRPLLTRDLPGAVAVVCSCALPAFADIDPNSGIDFVRIGAVGNAAWPGDHIQGDIGIGRGQVNYEYGIGKYEVNTAQWAEFFNAAFDRSAGDTLPFVLAPAGQYWGAVSTTPNNPGGRRWNVPAGNQMRAVGTISWRTAAMYCNWLTNNKSTNREAFLSGAYDVSTFGVDAANGGFSDQRTHSPGAKYWIPTLDEWQKAAHYDPDKNGPGQGGWWRFSITQDTLPAYGPPGVHVNATAPVPDPNGPIAQINGGWRSVDFPGYSPFTIPLGAYPDSRSPWGLLDTGGATSEWLEEIIGPAGIPNLLRLYQGSAWSTSSSGAMDAVNVFTTGESPNSSPFFDFGLRLSTNVPAPGLGGLGLVVLLFGTLRARRQGVPHETSCRCDGLCNFVVCAGPGANVGPAQRDRTNRRPC